MPQNITSKEYYSGKQSCRIDSIQQFSIGAEIPNKKISILKKLNISFWIKCHRKSEAILVLSSDRDGKNIFWNGIHIKDLITEKDQKWQKVFYEFNIPVSFTTNNDYKFSTYIWYPKKGAETIYIDDFKIED